jgi:hypothetical protein
LLAGLSGTQNCITSRHPSVDRAARAALGYAGFRRLRRDFSSGMGLDLLARRFRPLLGAPTALPSPAREAAAR